MSVKNELHYTAVLAKRILVILWLYTLARFYFYFSNRSLFPGTDFFTLIKCSFYGLRFDLFAIVYTNIIFILMHIIPFGFRDKRWYQVICKILFYTVNASLFIIMICDAEYFSFSLRHGTAELLDFMFDFIPLFPAYLVDFWYLIPISILIFLITEFLYRRTKKMPKKKGSRSDSFRKVTVPTRNFFIQFLLFIIIGGLSFLAMRGGFQKYPLAPIHAGKYVPPSLTPLVINTPFSIIHSIFHRGLKPLNYFTPEELKQNFDYVKQPLTDSLPPFNLGEKENVFIIIMESYSAEYTNLYGVEKSATPFLDSLSKNSLVFTQMKSNGMRSVDGIPAILAGIPAQTEESFLSSIYQSNNYKGLAAYLKEMGYSTAYFHGGQNGTFNLDNFAYASGFEKYFGKNEYSGKKEDNSHWGIYDEPFFRFTGQQANKMKPPFLAALFSLSSHHPYEVPQDYKNKFPQHPDQVLNSVQYADHALQEFFKQIEKEKWFRNTLFVITADHCGPALNEVSNYKINRLHVPLIFYHPTDSFFRGQINTTVQHIDILPTLLDYLRYPRPYCSFGAGIFRNQAHFSYAHVYGYDYIMDGHYVLEMFDGQPIALYEMNTKRELYKNIMDQHLDVVDKLSKRGKAFLQTYTGALIENNMIY